MTEVSKATYTTSIATLAPDNTSGSITAANVRSLYTDAKDSAYFLLTNTISDITNGVAGPASSVANQMAIANGTSGLIVKYSTNTIDASNNIVMTTASGFSTDTTAGHTALLQAYDVDGTAYKAFGTLTANNTPSLAFAQPSGATMTWDGGAIGGSTPAAGAFTTVSATGLLTASAGLLDGGIKRQSAQVDVTSSAALVDLTGLSISLTAGAQYLFRAFLPCTSGASGGVKVQLITADTLTLTSSDLTGFVKNTAVSDVIIHTTAGLSTSVAAVNQIAQAVIIEGTLVVNAAGTLKLQAAQNTSNGTTTSFFAGGTIHLTRIT